MFHSVHAVVAKAVAGEVQDDKQHAKDDGDDSKPFHPPRGARAQVAIRWIAFHPFHSTPMPLIADVHLRSDNRHGVREVLQNKTV